MLKTIVILILLSVPFRCFALELIDDEKYNDDAAKSEIEADGNPLLLLEVAGKYMEARNYTKAASIYADIIKKYLINQSMIYSNQSVFLGKTKDYVGAIAMADKALKLDPGSVHAKIVKASWLWESGKHDEAMALYNSVKVPVNGSFDEESLYYGCKACFFGSVGQKDGLSSAIKKCMELKDEHFIVFIKRDIVFDPYRKDDWFIALVGVTLK